MINLIQIFTKHKKVLYFFTIFIFSTSFNQFYGNLGVCPIDSFWFFNAGYDALNGYYPFKDYWTIAGPFITFTQAILFKIFGVSWFSYVLHASLFNFLISISTFYTLNKLKLNINYSFFYAILVAVVAYPSAGTPYVDHHASILSVLSIFIFILAINTKSKFYWFFLPIVLFVSFLTKQAPTGHIFLIISFLSIVYFVFNFNIIKIFYSILGSIFIILLFILILSITSISFTAFIDQYINFPLSIGKMRFELFLFPLEFTRIFLRFKIIHLSYLILILVTIKCLKKDFKYLKSNEFLITLSIILTSYALIAHQLMTINGMFIYFIIPILAGFSHIYYKKHYIYKKNILNLILLFTFFSTVYYGYKYVHKRDFMDLRNANMSKTVDANIFSNQLNGLKWISCLNQKNPKNEISQLLEIINIIKKDKRVKSIITDYQFISVILSSYDYSSSQVWFINHVVNHEKENYFFKLYKDFFINNIKNNKIEVAYVIKPLWGGNNVFENGLNKNCYKKEKVTEIADLYILTGCEDLN